MTDTTRVKGADITLKVSGGSQVSKVAGAIAKYIQENSNVSLVAIGAGAVNQMVKACCMARGMVAQGGLDLFVRPGFSSENIDGVTKTAIRFSLFTA